MLMQFPGCKYHLYDDSSHILISGPEFHVCIFSCLHDNFTWMSYKHLKLNIFKTKLLISSTKPPPPSRPPFSWYQFHSTSCSLFGSWYNLVPSPVFIFPSLLGLLFVHVNKVLDSHWVKGLCSDCSLCLEFFPEQLTWWTPSPFLSLNAIFKMKPMMTALCSFIAIDHFA